MDKYTMLGIHIEYTFEGTHELMSFNSDPSWVKLLGDITELKQIDKPVNQEWSLEVVQKIDSGYLVRVICPNAGRKDYACASIYVPWNIVISGKELSSIVSSTREEIMSWSKETSKSLLTELFSKKYDMVDSQQKSYSKTPTNIAYRYYGDYFQLHELLDNLEQPYYLNYKYIFLVSDKFNIVFNTGDDLTKMELVKPIITVPPKECEGFVHIDGKPFVKSMYGVEGDKIKIEWRRNGYKSIQTESIVAKEMKYSIPTPNQYQRVIPYSTIKVVDEYGISINDYELYVNQKYINKGEQIIVNEAVVDNVSLTISANGYESQICNNVNLNQGIKVRLKKEKFKYEFILPLKNGEGDYPINISSNCELKDSPIEGYCIEKGYIKRNSRNYLIYKPLKAVKRSYIIFGLVCLLIIFMLGLCGGYVVSNYIGGGDREQVTELQNQIKVLESRNTELQNQIKILESRNTELQKRIENPVTKPKKTNATKTLEDAIKYLNNEKWILKEMESYADLKGLWNIINNRKFNDIIYFANKHSRLEESKNFKRLLEEIKKCDGKDLQFRRPNYCGIKDSKITIEHYINHLKVKREEYEKEKENYPRPGMTQEELN